MVHIVIKPIFDLFTIQNLAYKQTDKVSPVISC